MKVAQHFSAGKAPSGARSPRSGRLNDSCNRFVSCTFRFQPSVSWAEKSIIYVPAINRWVTFIRPLAD